MCAKNLNVLSYSLYLCVKQTLYDMKKILLLTLALAFNLPSIWADKQIDLIRPRGDDRTEIPVPPKASYNEDTQEDTLSIEADTYFTMVVLDIYGTKVYSCPVLMGDGTPTNYQRPELPAGIYTLKVESPEVSYEGTLVIE